MTHLYPVTDHLNKSPICKLAWLWSCLLCGLIVALTPFANILNKCTAACYNIIIACICEADFLFHSVSMFKCV